MQWLHCRILSVVPLIWAGTWRASSIAAIVPPATPTPVVLRKPRRVTLVGLISRVCPSLIGGTSFERCDLWDGSEKGKLFIRLRRVLSSGISCHLVECAHAPRHADPRGGRRGHRPVRGRPGVAPDRCAATGRRA